MPSHTTELGLSNIALTAAYATPDEFWEHSHQPVLLLDLLTLSQEMHISWDNRGYYDLDALRKFTCWCGRSVAHLKPDPSALHAVAIAEDVCADTASKDALNPIWKKSQSLIASWSEAIKQQRDVTAAASLACVHAARYDELTSARSAAEYAVRAQVWDRIPVVPGTSPDLLEAADLEVASEVYAQQADHLRALLGRPLRRVTWAELLNRRKEKSVEIETTGETVLVLRKGWEHIREDQLQEEIRVKLHAYLKRIRKSTRRRWDVQYLYKVKGRIKAFIVGRGGYTDRIFYYEYGGRWRKNW